MVQKRDGDAPKRRGRPRAYDPATAVARAAATFWKEGYAGTSLHDLAAATGMNRPSLYAAFGDKRDLYLKTLEYYRGESRALTARALAGDPPLRVFLDRFYAGALDLYYVGDHARGCYTIGTAATVAAFDADVREFLAQSMRNADALMKSQIEKAKERGEIGREVDPTALAYLATATLHTLAIRSRAGMARKELDALAKTAIGAICGRK